MLTPEQINVLGDRAADIVKPVNDFLISDIARRVAGAGQLTSTAAYQIYRAQQLGMSREEIEKELQKRLNVSKKELEELLTQSAEVGYRFDLDRFSAAAVPFEENESLQQIVNSAVKLAKDDFTSLTQTLGMVAPDGKAYPLQKSFEKCMDHAFSQVITGATDYNTAIRNATKNLADMGIRTVDYESGVHTSLEAAVRRNVMGGMGLMQEKISEENHDKLGADGWEISAHAASAPDHEPIQGRQYPDEKYKKLNNSLVRRIGTLNCGHAAFPIILGVNSPMYTDEELEKFRKDNEEGVTYNGKHYTLYEATQKQRQIERGMRKQKNRILVDEATDDADKLLSDRIRLVRYNDEYKRFSKAVNLPTQHERARVANFDYKKARQATSATNDEFKKIIDISKKGGTIKLNEDMENIIAYKPYKDIESLNGKLSDRAARKWYLAQDSLIPEKIDTSMSIKEQAITACELRNTNRTQARDLMRDQKKRQKLDISDPNKSFEELVTDKMARKHLTEEEAYLDILETATKTRKTVNKKLGLE